MNEKTKITVASYNVQCLSYGTQLTLISEEIKDINPDIIGIQELDSFTNRSGKSDQIKELAESCGYKYYYFSKTIDCDDGEYGHGIMSKYPITNFQTIPFESQYSENRCFSRSEIEIDGKKIAFYNTHLEFLGDIQSTQISEIFKFACQDKYFVITGDMNCSPITYNYCFNSEKIISLNGGKTYNNFINTYPEGDFSQMPIDNILVSKSFKYYYDKENDTGIFVNKTTNSDHNMIYTHLEF